MVTATERAQPVGASRREMPALLAFGTDPGTMAALEAAKNLLSTCSRGRCWKVIMVRGGQRIAAGESST